MKHAVFSGINIRESFIFCLNYGVPEQQPNRYDRMDSSAKQASASMMRLARYGVRQDHQHGNDIYQI